MGKRNIREGQVGDFWPDRRKGRDGEDDPYFICWFDARTRQVKRKRTVATDFEEACKLVREHAYLNDRPELASRDNISISKVLLVYWEEHAQHIPSARTAKNHIIQWNKYWGDRPVSDITKAEQRKFRAFIGEGEKAPSTIDKILATGSAALNYAVNNDMLASAPKLALIETDEEKEDRQPLGEPITPITAARLLDHVVNKRLLMFIMIAMNTLSRPCAIYDLQVKMYDPVTGHLNLQPAWRKRTKKRRPKIAVTPSLRRWLEVHTDPDVYYVSGTKSRIRSVHVAFKDAVRRAGLSEKTNPYSFRHGLAQWMADHDVPDADIDSYLGHSLPGSKITKIYTKTRAERHRRGTDAIELFVQEVRKHLKVARLDDPDFLDHTPPEKGYGRKLKKGEADLVLKLIHKGEGTSAIARAVGCSETAIRKRKKVLRRQAERDAFQVRAKSQGRESKAV